MIIAVAVTVRLSIPQHDTASTSVVASATTKAGSKAADEVIKGEPGIIHKANQVPIKVAMKKLIDPSIVRLHLNIR